VLAFVLAVSAFALVGLPPTAGFTGKLFLFASTWGRGFDWLIIVAAVNTAISIFYYLNMVRYAYTREPGEGEQAMARPHLWANAFGLLLAVGILAIGMLPGSVFELAAMAGQQLLP